MCLQLPGDPGSPTLVRLGGGDEEVPAGRVGRRVVGDRAGSFGLGAQTRGRHLHLHLHPGRTGELRNLDLDLAELPWVEPAKPLGNSRGVQLVGDDERKILGRYVLEHLTHRWRVHQPGRHNGRLTGEPGVIDDHVAVVQRHPQPDPTGVVTGPVVGP